LSGFGEFDLIARLRTLAGKHPRVPLGIGDDAAIVGTSEEGRWLVAADMLLEGRHFDVASATARQIGRKALAVNLSDIAAMAGRPAAAFVTVAHRREYGILFAEELHAGIQELASEFNVAIAGGDTNVWDGPVVVSVTVIGEITGRGAVTRSGAREGDSIFVTGRLGGSLVTGRHLAFTPRVDEALKLHERYELHAMIDISDGLLADLNHICEESKVGAALSADAIPMHASVLSQDVTSAENADQQTSALAHALTDGEDFELAFCIGEEDAERLREATPAREPPFFVGRIVAGAGVEVLDAAGKPLLFQQAGWVHRW
jgi:thiamine-monophosphate kinase